VARARLFVRTNIKDHHFAGQNAEAGLAIESLSGFVAIEDLQFDRANATFAAEVLQFIKSKRANATIAVPLVDVQVGEHALDATVFQIEIVGQERIAHRLVVRFQEPGLTLGRVAQECFQTAAERSEMVRNFVVTVVSGCKFDKSVEIFRAAGAEGYKHRASH